MDASLSHAAAEGRDNARLDTPLFESLELRLLLTSDLAAGILTDAGILATPSRPIVFVDSAVEGHELIVAGLEGASSEPASEGRLEVVVLDPDRDGAEQITEALATRRDVPAVYVISHGSPGSVQLGRSYLDGVTLDRYAQELSSWQAWLAPTADVLLYGCNVGAGVAGEAFIADLAALTGADVAASTDATGPDALGGDWDLEERTGPVELPPVGVWLSG
jgi:hypothetical protein